jgi:hypothetical protein
MSDTTTLSWNANWVQANTGRTLTIGEARCIDTLAVIDTGIYNVHPLGGWKRVEFRGTWICLHVHRGFSTYDSDHMTRLVIAGHRNAVRVDLYAALICAEWNGDDVRYRWEDDGLAGEWDAAGEMGAAMRIQLNARNRHGTHLFERHPTLNELINRTLGAQVVGA